MVSLPKPQLFSKVFSSRAGSSDPAIGLPDSQKIAFGNDADITVAWDGTDMDVLQATANSAINLGVDGAGIDLKVFGDTASAYLLWDQSADQFILAGVAALAQFRRKITAKTGDYTVTAADSGTVFTTTGAAGAVTFTLPALAAGLQFTIINTVDQNLVITAPGDNMIYNNDTVTTLTWSTAGDKLGVGVTIYCDGTNYLVLDHSPSTGFTAGVGS